MKQTSAGLVPIRGMAREMRNWPCFHDKDYV